MRNSKPSVLFTQKPIEQYEHTDKQRVNNPPVGLVDSHTDNGGQNKKTYAYDPHLEPQLQWAGKAEHTSFEVPTVSLHVHERIDPRRIIESVRKEDDGPKQPSFWDVGKKPLREAIEFYKHKENWSNRLIAGDSLLVMNSLLEKEGMGGKVQMVYFDPPYGIKYGSNFQPFINKRDVTDGRDEDLTAEPEMIKAFRDTWELGIHSYLTYIRDRLLLAKDLLTENGSIFVQISAENVHRVRDLLDEVFGAQNFVSLIPFGKTAGSGAKIIGDEFDYLLWYGRGGSPVKGRTLFLTKSPNMFKSYKYAVSPDVSQIRGATADERTDPSTLPQGWKLAQLSFAVSQDPGKLDERIYNFRGVDYDCGENRHWKTKNPDGLNRLAKANRLVGLATQLNYIRYYDDFPSTALTNNWSDTGSAGFSSTDPKVFVVQTDSVVIRRCILMTTDPGDLVLDITCGSGTTAFVAENWGRRWITCDTSRVATALAKQRLMTGGFDYFQLAHPDEGVGSGFRYKSVPHITLKSIANNEPAPQEALYDQPFVDDKKHRVTGPFTVEAVPAPYAKSPLELDSIDIAGDVSVARSGESLRQSEWIDRLKDGVRGKSGEKIEFTRVEPLSGTHFLQADAETKEDNPKRVVVCFGPEHAPLEQRMVEQAIEEARSLVPKPQILLFCAFQFDPEARKDIDETNWPGMTFLEAQMDADLQIDDLKKKPRDKDSPAFWLIGQPDVRPIRLGGGKYQVEVLGFDYYNPKTGTVDSGGKPDIAMWMLDPDYDGRSLFPTQVFFPMAGDKEGWAKLVKNLRAEIDEEKIEAFRGTISLPFSAGRAVAVKIIDARGIESLKIIRM